MLAASGNVAPSVGLGPDRRRRIRGGRCGDVSPGVRGRVRSGVLVWRGGGGSSGTRGARANNASRSAARSWPVPAGVSVSRSDAGGVIVIPSRDTPTRNVTVWPCSLRQRTVQVSEALHPARSSTARTVFRSLRRFTVPTRSRGKPWTPAGRRRSGSASARRSSSRPWRPQQSSGHRWGRHGGTLSDPLGGPPRTRQRIGQGIRMVESPEVGTPRRSVGLPPPLRSLGLATPQALWRGSRMI